jgi:hypothetical protein
MLDCQLFGLNPFWHHLTNLLFHIVNSLLLFWVLKRMTGAVWPSLFVAAAFALHPLHVESVAWVAERKDVLSGFFWMLTIAVYIRYAERPAVGSYLLLVLFFSLALLAKPMVVTLPFVLLLLDYWPLRRLQLGWDAEDASRQQTNKSVNKHSQQRNIYRLLWEKVPFFTLSAALSIITFFVQRSAGAIAISDPVPLHIRFINALVSYIGYIVKMVYPASLAVLYPYPKTIRADVALLTVVISVLVVRWGRRRPWLTVGWLWYLVALVPVIGLVQAGSQAMADRYTYLSLIGLFIMVAWGAGELLAKWRYRKICLAVSAGLWLTAMLICSRMQLRHWRNSLTLYEHTLAVTQNNYIIHNNLATALGEQGKLDEAISHYRQAVRINPNYANGHNNLGLTLTKQGKFNEAVVHFTEALRIKPDFIGARRNLGYVLERLRRSDKSATPLKKTEQPDHDSTLAH